MIPERAAICLGALVLTASCHSSPPKTRQAVRIEPIAPGANQNLNTYSGTAQAETQVDVSFKVGGYVVSIPGPESGARGGTRLLQAGDRVRKGELLASLRGSDFKARLAELRGVRGDAAAAYARAKADYDRARTLLSSGSMSQAEFDNARARLGSAAGEVAAANARVSEAGIALSDANLRAPLDGIVLTRAIEVGTLVAPGAVAFTIADMSTMRILFAVPDSVQHSLAVDQAVTVTTDALQGRTFSGTVTKLAFQADPKTRLFDVEATVYNDDGALKVGMVMQIQLNTSSSGPPAALIPLSAVVRPPDASSGFAAYVVTTSGTDQTAHVRAIQLGDLVANRVAVTSGLRLGDQLVIQGATLLTDGQAVTVVP